VGLSDSEKKKANKQLMTQSCRSSVSFQVADWDKILLIHYFTKCFY